jgi:argininosuccinate lyase
MHLSRLAEELILWSTEEFGFVTMSDACSTGSSIMPQKKNPDFAELVRGKTGRVYGDLIALLTTMKGLPLAYNKDMQEDKEPLFDAVETTSNSLKAMTGMIDTLAFNEGVLCKAAQGGFMAATDLADYLVGKGMAFRDAHEVVGKIVRGCIDNDKTLQDLTVDDYKKACDLFDDDVLDVVDISKVVARRKDAAGNGNR